MSKPRFPFSTSDDPLTRDNIEHLRRGTVDTFESPWVMIRSDSAASGAFGSNAWEKKSFVHKLGIVPMSVDVSVSEAPGGSLAIGAIEGAAPAGSEPGPVGSGQDGNGYYQIAGKDKNSIEIINVTGRDMYFRVRAR